MDILEARKKAKKKRKKKSQQESQKPADEAKTPEPSTSQQPDDELIKALEEADEKELQDTALEALSLQEEEEKTDTHPQPEPEPEQAHVEMQEEVFQQASEKEATQEEKSFAEIAEETLLQQVEEELKGQEQRFLTFKLGKEFFAVEIDNIREIVKPRPVTEVPGVDEVILGIVSVRGNIMPVVDVGRKVGMLSQPFTPDKWDRRTRFIIFNFNRVLVAMVVECVTGVISAYKEEIEPVPSMTRGPAEEYIKGIIRRDKEIYSLLNLREIFDFIFHRAEEENA